MANEIDATGSLSQRVELIWDIINSSSGELRLLYSSNAACSSADIVEIKIITETLPTVVVILRTGPISVKILRSNLRSLNEVIDSVSSGGDS